MEIIYPFILFLGGLLSGLYAASVGSAGLVNLPLLILTGLPIHVAIGTSRVAAVILEISSGIRFYRAGKINIRRGILLGAIAAAGSLIGASAIIRTDEKWVQLFIAILLAGLTVVLAVRKKMGTEERPWTERTTLKAGAGAFLLGIYGGSFGVGFGSFIIFLLASLGMSFMTSAATSRLIGLMMTGSALLLFAKSGLVDYRYGLAMGFGAGIGGWLGAGIGIRKGNTFIKNALFAVIALAIAKILMKSFY